MAKYRQLHTSFWQDGFVLDLTPEEKYFYLYLMTNSKTSQCGIYELPKRIIEIETGYNRETVQKLLQRFVDYQKIDYHEGTKEIMIINWIKYNPPNNANAIKCIVKELTEVKNVEFARLYIGLAKENSYELEGLPRGLQGATDTLPSNKVINNKEEIRSNKEEVIIETEDKSSEPPTEEREKVTMKKIYELYNSICTKLPKATVLSDNRKRAIKTLYTKYSDIEKFETVFKKANESNFLKGENTKGWTASFDWIMKEVNFIKILEDRYANREVTKEEKPRNGFHNYKGREYDFDDLEKKLTSWEENY